MWRVEVAEHVREKAAQVWLPELARPSVTAFDEGPLAAARFQCRHGFDQLAPESPGSPVRLLILSPTALFPPVVFYVVEVADHSGSFVEIVDFTADLGYWTQLDDDLDG